MRECNTTYLNEHSHKILMCFVNLYTFFDKKLLYEKLVLGQPNGLETFSTQATGVKKLFRFSFVFLSQFCRCSNQVKKKDMFRKESLTYKQKLYRIRKLQVSVIFHLVAKSAVKTKLKSVVICFQLPHFVFFSSIS